MKKQTRKLIAIGDLHGDVYRLVRILSEENVLDPVTRCWTKEAGHADVILLGDYVDWRGEPLEGPREEWPLGPRNLIELIQKLHQENLSLRRDRSFRGRFYPLCGNHDEMMLESYVTLEGICRKEEGLLERYPTVEALLRFAASDGLDLEGEEKLLRVMNWIQQGGDKTIQSFGGLHGWLARVGGELGDFIKKLPLAVVVNEKLFSHSVPDSREYWVPVYETQAHSKEDYAKIREQYLWGRKVWGYDAFAGGRTNPLTENEIDEMLSKLKVKAVVVGHTSMRQKGPYFHFGGKIINIDTHGIPGSRAFVEVYEPPRIALRKVRAGKPARRRRSRHHDGKS